MRSVAIIGAGISGLAAAQTLQETGWSVRIFEKSRGVGGRAGTRRREGFIYDHGAQYIRQGSPESVSLITERFRTSDLITIRKPIWIFDEAGSIQEGDAQQNAEPKWSYRSGLTALAKRMAEGLSIQQERQISQIRQTEQGWELIARDGEVFGYFEKVLITIPTSQASLLIKNSPLEEGLRSAICAKLDQASYNPLLSIMLGYRVRPRVRPYYALVNTDKAHTISWLAWEHEKAEERVPEGAGLLIAQMAPGYSQEHWETGENGLVADVAQRVASLLKEEELEKPTFRDVQRWRYALPREKADAERLNELTMPIGLAFCGDGFVGGRVHLALEHGIAVVKQLLEE